ncbi:disease resistance protein Pik-2-like, partial [Triticum dicoccoides]|uniref:disease resistance protein Pik-2-like n=1 Tax=Triticum dicoccoides TaxID=85692 RepID=UPI00188EB6C7
ITDETRYLIVIDDIWTIAAWDAIRSRLPGSKCGRIIVTTRIKTVANECSDVSATEDYIHHMEPLKSEDSKELFISRAFGSSVEKASHTEELEDIMGRILKKCAGLPLAIVSIASLLANYKYPESKDMWETVWKSIGSQMESNPTLEGMTQILTLSYNHLPYYLKGCMMYLGIFPEDYEIPRNRLLYRWIAEGLVEEKRGLTLMEVAEGYFEELLSRSMIDPASSVSYHGKRMACRVHDMMLEIMVSKSIEANFVSMLGGQYEGMSYDRVRRLSIHGGASSDSPSMKGGASGRHGKRNSIERLEVQHVRSLSMFDLQEKKLFDRLGEFTLLRVLDLEDCQGLENKHVKDICKMYLLRFLSMKRTNISVLPEKVGELEHLQVLDVECTGLEKLPETITRLEKLERLRFRKKDNWRIMWKPPAGLCKMKVLRDAGCVHITDVQVAKELGELVDLREVTIFVDEPRESTKPILDELVKSICKLYSLRYLGIGSFEIRKLNFLSGMGSPSVLIQSLYLDGQIDKIPDWVSSLHNLVEMELICSLLRDDQQLYGVLCKLPNLQVLKIFPGAYVGRKLVARSAHKFPVLRNLSFDCCIDVIEFEDGAMDTLEGLNVNFGHGVNRIVGIQHLKNLKEVKLISYMGSDQSSLNDALCQLKEENERRQIQFTVGVQYK